MPGTIEYVNWDTTTGGTVPNGWTCSNCGAWVANATTHTCLWRWPSAVTYSPPTRLTDDEIERIAQRVAELIKPKRKARSG